MSTGLVPKPKGQVAQTRKDGGGSVGPQRLRALHNDGLVGPDARLESGAARRPLAVAAPAVRAARLSIAPADRLPELPDAARCAQLVAHAEVAAVTATNRRHAAVVVVVAVHVVVDRVRRHRP